MASMNSLFKGQTLSLQNPAATPRQQQQSKVTTVTCSSSSSSSSGMTDSQGGRIVRQVLSNEGRTKMNAASDRGFYSSPRLVTHVDDAFLSSLTSLYRERIPDDAEVLDLMSSWVSHLPGNTELSKKASQWDHVTQFVPGFTSEMLVVADLMYRVEYHLTKLLNSYLEAKGLFAVDHVTQAVNRGKMKDKFFHKNEKKASVGDLPRLAV